MKQSNRQQQAVERLKSIDAGNDFFFNEETGAAKFIKGRLSKSSDKEPAVIARGFLDEYAGLLDLQDGLDESLEVSHIETDRQGFSHVYFAQSINGIPVFEGATQVHIDAGGAVVAYKDHRLARVDISLEPRITEQDAISIALGDSGSDTEQIAENSALLELFRGDSRKLHLAWRVKWLAKNDLAPSFHMIDAHSGEVLFKYTHMRGILSRLTYSAENGNNLRARLILEDNQSTGDAVAQAAHENAKMVYDYYLDTFGRDSYDAHGSPLVSSVHFLQHYNNAFWANGYDQMVYGDGDGIRFAPLSLALDVVGHELTHAVTSRTARFVYAEQAGALDESFADFFGVMVANDGEIVDWLMGEGVYTPHNSGDALRDLSSPARYGQPDHMNSFMALASGEHPDPDKNDNGYVHSNSGIPNKAAYLTVAGGTHHGVSVAGIGREKTEQIYYLALTSYLSSATDSRWTFEQARYALLNACRQLYGDDGSEYDVIKNAWAAVGVGEAAGDFTVIHQELSPSQQIPDNDPAGISNIIHIDEQGLLQDIYVGIQIDHGYIGDLRVILTSPSGESVVLHDRRGGASRDLVETYDLDSLPDLNAYIGDDVHGDWQLAVTDNARSDVGTLLYWELSLSIRNGEKQEIAKEASPQQQIPDNDPAGIESGIEIDVSGNLVRLDVPVEITHTWIGDLRVTLVSPSGTEVVLHNRSGSSRDDISTIFSTTSNEEIRQLVGEKIQGNWLLKVADEYEEDVGMLRKWGLLLTYS